VADVPVKIMPLTFIERLWGAIAAVLLGLAMAMVLWLILPSEARAEGVVFDCVELATAMSLVADFRDAGGELEKTVRVARRDNANMPAPHMRVIEREVRRIWAEGKPKRLAVLGVYTRCKAQLGDMGRES
jgi:hypothetical protein